MINKQILIVSAKEIASVKDGNIKVFIKDIIAVTQKLPNKNKIEIQGGFENKEDGSLLFVLNQE